MSEDQTREPDQPETDQPETDPANDLQDPDAELHEGDAGIDHVPGESYRTTFRLN